MVNLYKRYEAWVTNLKSDIFAWARIKLTFIYLIIIGLVLAASSILLYSSLQQHIRGEGYDKLHSAPYIYVDDPTHIKYATPADQETFAEDTLENTATYIIFIDLFIFILCAIVSYILAGYTLKPIKEALQAQESFSADASHELRTPLSIIKNSIEIALRSNNPSVADLKEVLESCLEETNYMSQTTESLLQLARGSKSTDSKTFVLIDSNEILKNVFTTAKKLAEAKGVNLSFENLGTIPVRVMGDRNILNRLFLNLVENAISYTKTGGNVKVKQKIEDGLWKIEISDDGVGIDKKDLPHVFERFYKANLSREVNTENRGSGLGLAIVKNAVEIHRGQIEINSILNKGTDIIVKLPITKDLSTTEDSSS